VNKDSFREDIEEIAEKNNRGFFGLEIIPTQACNMDCSYCFEHKKECGTIRNPDMIVKRVDELLNDEWFNNTYKGLKIDYWGGEPTLKTDIIEMLLDRYVKNPRVSFHIYSNGYQVDTFYYVIERYIDDILKQEKKFDIQFSYDGQPIHDIRRKDNFGNKTAEKILENTDRFYNLGLPVNFKSTVVPEDFKYIPEVWDDFRRLCDRYPKHQVGYCPTIDYINTTEVEYVEDFEKSMVAIAKKEIGFHREMGRFLFTWFDGSRPACTAGKDLVIVDINGSVYFCHGVLYNGTKEELKITSIGSDNFVRDIERNREKMMSYEIVEPLECELCPATKCMRCNARKYELSEMEELGDRWHDYTNQSNLCTYFKIFGNIHRAVREIIIGE